MSGENTNSITSTTSANAVSKYKAISAFTRSFISIAPDAIDEKLDRDTSDDDWGHKNAD